MAWKRNSLIINCYSESPKKQDMRASVSRVLCHFQIRPFCPSCAHSRFVFRFQPQIGQQQVACPAKKYEIVSRTVCIADGPLSFCSDCPNSDASEPGRTGDGWYQAWRKRRVIKEEEE